MKKIWRGYWRTLKQYWQYPKGRFDIIDYGKAILLILLTMSIGIWLAREVGGR